MGSNAFNNDTILYCEASKKREQWPYTIDMYEQKLLFNCSKIEIIELAEPWSKCEFYVGEDICINNEKFIVQNIDKTSTQIAVSKNIITNFDSQTVGNKRLKLFIKTSQSKLNIKIYRWKLKKKNQY